MTEKGKQQNKSFLTPTQKEKKSYEGWLKVKTRKNSVGMGKGRVQFVIWHIYLKISDWFAKH